MKIKLSRPNEWGCFIDPVTLDIKELKGEIPQKTLVIIRKREYKPEISRALISTIYAITSKSGLIYLTKRDFAKLLSKKCSEYMLEKEKIPLRVTLAKKIVENKPVELLYNIKKNKAFQLKITEELLKGKNPKEFIENLISASQVDIYTKEIEKTWRIEYTPRGGSICKKCKRQIREKEIRFSELQIEKNIIKQLVYHYRCMDWKKLKENLVHGLDNLKEEDQKQIKKKFK